MDFVLFFSSVCFTNVYQERTGHERNSLCWVHFSFHSGVFWIGRCGEREREREKWSAFYFCTLKYYRIVSVLYTCGVFLYFILFFSLLTDACITTKTQPELKPGLGRETLFVQKEKKQNFSPFEMQMRRGGGRGATSALCVTAGKQGVERGAEV